MKAAWRIKVGPARQGKVITGIEPIQPQGSFVREIDSSLPAESERYFDRLFDRLKLNVEP